MHTMGIDPRNNGRDLTRITISGGKRAEPRLMMAHPSWRKRDYRLAVLFVIAIVVIIALAGASR
jgi:hypothetical protein